MALLLRPVSVLLLVVLAACGGGGGGGGSSSGDLTGSYRGNLGSTPIEVNLNQDGTNLTGNYSTSDGDRGDAAGDAGAVAQSVTAAQTRLFTLRLISRVGRGTCTINGRSDNDGAQLSGPFTCTNGRSGQFQAVRVSNTPAPAPTTPTPTPPPPQPQTFRLTVTVSGGTTSAGSTLTSAPAGISCTFIVGNRTCQADFSSGTTVRLTVSPSTAITFGFKGDCTASGLSCSVVMSANRSVTVTGP
jgi:hypothetical protein